MRATGPEPRFQQKLKRTIIYLVPAASLTTRMLEVRNQNANDCVESKRHPIAVAPSDRQSVEAG